MNKILFSMIFGVLVSSAASASETRCIAKNEALEILSIETIKAYSQSFKNVYYGEEGYEQGLDNMLSDLSYEIDNWSDLIEAVELDGKTTYRIVLLSPSSGYGMSCSEGFVQVGCEGANFVIEESSCSFDY